MKVWMEMNSNRLKGRLIVLFFLLFCAAGVWGQQYALKENVSYVGAGERDVYRQERCKLDVYYPTDVKDFPTVVWLHGGGLEGGSKHIPDELKGQGMAVVSVNYRLSPLAEHPAYIVDAAEAVAWTFANISAFGGNPDKVFVSGHSAGGYLALMVALDKAYLGRFGADADRLAGIIPVSGQTNTHYTIRKERGLDLRIPVVDEYAPLNRARKVPFPILLVTGDRRLEMTARYEENAHLDAILRSLGNEDVELYELQGFDHGTVLAPACRLAVEFVDRQQSAADGNK